MLRKCLIRCAAALVFLLLCPLARGQEALLGLFQSPKGVGVTATFGSAGAGETDILTLRTDFTGLLTGRTEHMGVCISYTHDYPIYQLWGDHFDMTLHAGAGGLVGYVQDWEKGLFSQYDRAFKHKHGDPVVLPRRQRLCLFPAAQHNVLLMMKGRKLLLIIILLSSLQVSSFAQIRARESLPRLRFGAEWGYTQCFFLLRDYNFVSDEGYRV